MDGRREAGSRPARRRAGHRSRRRPATRQRQHRGAQVVDHVTPLALAPEGSSRGAEHTPDRLLQLRGSHPAPRSPTCTRTLLPAVTPRPAPPRRRPRRRRRRAAGEHPSDAPGRQAVGRPTGPRPWRCRRTPPAIRTRWAGPARSSAGAGVRSPRCRPPAGRPGAGPAPTCGPRRGGSSSAPGRAW